MTDSTPDLPAVVLPEETDPVRREIVQAIRRILDGVPSRVDPGRTSVVALSTEAGVSLNRLNRRDKDLRDLFQRLVAQGDQPTPREASILARVDKLATENAYLKRKYDEVRESRDDWKSAAETFVRALQVKEQEIRELQQRVEIVEGRERRLKDENANLRQRASGSPTVTPFTGPRRPQR